MTPYKILVADELSEEGLAILKNAGEVTFQKGLNEESLRTKLQGFHALVVRSATQVTARSLELADSLVLIGRAGIGIDNIDVPAATAKGIVVMNTPEAGAVTTGEHAIALMLSLARQIPAADASVRAGKWEKSKFTGVEIAGKQLGILGLGRIGQVVADRARGLSMNVVAYDPYLSQERAPQGVRLVDIDELLRNSDFVSIHMPLMDETKNFVSLEKLKKMKKGARLIHAARGGIVDEKALAQVLKEGHLAGAALDVFCEEPLKLDSELRECPNLILTPHLGASTHEAKFNVSLEMAQQIALCLQKGIVLNGVNVPRVAPRDAHVVGPFLGLVSNLSKILVQTFSKAGVLKSLNLSLQGSLIESAQNPLTVAMLVGALKAQRALGAAVTPVNARMRAEKAGLQFSCGIRSIKKDFQNFIRIEAVFENQGREEKHYVSGTVLGQKHGRILEVDDYVVDAIPEAPLLITFHEDQPGVMGLLCTYLGTQKVNIERMQISQSLDANKQPAIGIFNLEKSLNENQLNDIKKLGPVRDALVVF